MTDKSMLIYVGETEENGFWFGKYEHYVTKKHVTIKDLFLEDNFGLNNFVWDIVRHTRDHRTTSFRECHEWVKSLKL